MAVERPLKLGGGGDPDQGSSAAEHREDGELYESDEGTPSAAGFRGSGNLARYSTSERGMSGSPRNRAPPDYPIPAILIIPTRASPWEGTGNYLTFSLPWQTIIPGFSQSGRSDPWQTRGQVTHSFSSDRWEQLQGADRVVSRRGGFPWQNRFPLRNLNSPITPNRVAPVSCY